MYHYFFIHSFVNGHLGCFHVLAIVNTVLDEHWGICVLFFFFPIMVFSGFGEEYGEFSKKKKKKNWKSNDLKIN